MQLGCTALQMTVMAAGFGCKLAVPPILVSHCSDTIKAG